MSGQPQPQFDMEVDDYPLPPIVFDPGEADECEREVASASYNYSGLMGMGKPKRKKAMALVMDAEEFAKANQQLAMNAAQDFAEAVKSERVSVLESMGEDEGGEGNNGSSVYDAETEFAPGLDDFDDQVDAAVLQWSRRTVTLSDEADLIDEPAAADFQLDAMSEPVIAHPVEAVAPPALDERTKPALEAIKERAARLRDSIPAVPETQAMPVAVDPVREEPSVAAPPVESEWTAPQSAAPQPAAYAEPEAVYEEPVAFEPEPEPVFEPEPEFAPEPVAIEARRPVVAAEPAHGHALRARIVREHVDAPVRGSGNGGGLIARILAWFASLRG